MDTTRDLKGHAGLFFRGDEVEWDGEGIYFASDLEIWRRVKSIEHMERLLKHNRITVYLTQYDLTNTIE